MGDSHPTLRQPVRPWWAPPEPRDFGVAARAAFCLPLPPLELAAVRLVLVGATTPALSRNACGRSLGLEGGGVENLIQVQQCRVKGGASATFAQMRHEDLGGRPVAQALARQRVHVMVESDKLMLTHRRQISGSGQNSLRLRAMWSTPPQL